MQEDFWWLSRVQMAKMASEISKIDFLDQKMNFSVYIGQWILGVSEVKTNIVSAYLSIFRPVESPHTVANLCSSIDLATVKIASEISKTIF